MLLLESNVCSHTQGFRLCGGCLLYTSGYNLARDHHALYLFLTELLENVSMDGAAVYVKAVSYTHLDVYKRQALHSIGVGKSSLGGRF